MNPKCPHCGKQSLRAFVTATYTNVQLYKDGYSLTDGTLQEEEIQEITCLDCKEAVPVENYFEDNPDDPGH